MVLAPVVNTEHVQHPAPVLTCWDAGVITGAVLPVGSPQSVARRTDLRGHQLKPALVLWLAENIPIVENKSLRNHGADSVLRYTLFVNNSRHACYCYMKMSWGNCSVKMSSPHGDFHDEPEGIAPRRPGRRGFGRPNQQSGRRRCSAAHTPTVSAPEASGPLRRVQ